MDTQFVETQFFGDEADSEFLTVKEYALRRGVHFQTVYTAIRMGRFRYPVERVTAGAIRIRVPRATHNRAQSRKNVE